MTDAKNFLIGPLGLAVALCTVLAFVAAMLLYALSHSARTVPAGLSAPAAQPTDTRQLRGMSVLRRLAAVRWPLAVVAVGLTAYRIYSLS